jgi:hypothetical protein
MDKLQEEWRDIAGFEGCYQVSNIGRVRSLSRMISNGKGFYRSKDKILKPNTLFKGYLQVELKRSLRRHPLQVHRLVAIAFLPNTKNYPQVNHKNGDKQDNRVENLEWCDNSMNQKHAWENGLQKVSGKAGKPKRMVVLSKDNEVNIFESVADAMRFLGLKSNANIQKVLHKVKHYNTIKGYKAEYYD